ncbi:MAG: cation:proton antiporter [Candidatus Omnitrophota bacterium]|nr:cation:proton antiporter [Candidatus Omnitrophota bacterium]
MNLLLVIGLIILLGTIGGRIFKKLNLPQVTGYIIIGLLLGESFHGFLCGEIMASFAPLLNLALGIIGFMIGAEIRLDRFRRYSKSIYAILFCETLLTFVLVAAGTILVTGKLYMGFILGALASATAPAATYGVLGEYKARGPVTMTTLSIVALDDALALIIYGFASVFARSLIVHDTPSLIKTLAVPLIEIAVSVGIGAIAGIVLHKISIKARERDRILPFALGTIILVVGLALHFKVDPILASMVLGAVVSNLQPADNREMFEVIKRLSPPIFILFFVLVGARLNASIFAQSGVVLLAVVYIVSRSAGKMVGAYIGGKISGARDTVTKYLGFCLFDQAGVAVGLSIAVFTSFSGINDEAKSASILIISIITATTFILQLVAPSMIRYGIKRADEMNRNVTEDDIIDEHKVKDVMGEDFFLIRENNNLHQIIDIMKKSEAYNFPVVDMKGDFIGIILLGEMRDTLYEEQMDSLILAGDLVRDINAVVYAEDDLRMAIDMFRQTGVDYIPVMENRGSRHLVGQLEYKKIADYLMKEVMMRQKGLEI